MLLYRIEKANAQVITRSRTGNLPPAKAVVDSSELNKVTVSGKASAEEIKEKMEQQLRLQRAAHQQKRAMEVKNTPGQIIKMVGSTAQGEMRFFFNFEYVIVSLKAATTTTTKPSTTNTPIQPKGRDFSVGCVVTHVACFFLIH